MAFVELYERGFSVRRGGICFRKKVAGGRRGRITGKYSAASFRRLREYVITHDAEGDCWGITLTIPGLDNLSIEQFRRIHHNLLVWCNVHHIPLVWRVELQKRGMPHLHCVAYCNVSICLALFHEWFRLLSTLTVYSVERVRSDCDEIVLLPRSYVRGSSHAVNLCKLDGGFSAYRYLVAHMSKGKQEQLGYAGRQWGVVYRKSFRLSHVESWSVNEKVYYYLLRWVRRWTRRKVYASSGCSWWVSDSRILGRMCRYLVEREPRKGGAGGDVFSRGTRPLWLYSWYGLQWVSTIDFLQMDLIMNDIFVSSEKCIFDVITVLLMYDPESQTNPI